MKPTFFILFFLLNYTFLFAQSNYQESITMGDKALREGNFKKAINLYFAAEAFDPSKKEEVKTKINKTFDKIQQLKILADNDRNEALAQKEIALTALAKADTMQRRFENAIFDKAVKEKFKDWKGFEKYGSWEKKDRAEKLAQIDSLDLTYNALQRIPANVTYCPNLKHINLIGNPDLNWKQSEETLKKLNKNIGIYVSIRDISLIDSSYWGLITGIEILENGLTEIPKNILQQKQLNYLDLSAEYDKKNDLNKLPRELFKLTKLRYLNLDYCSISILPTEIFNLRNLTKLSLWGNQLSSLPAEIGNLPNLTELYLYENRLNSLPTEIRNLRNLTILYLSGNKLNSLPAEIGHLRKLTVLYLGGNKLDSLPVEIGELINMTSLSIGANQLRSLPVEIGKLQNLTLLYLGYNQLSSLPTEIGNLKHLIELDLKSNHLNSLPVVIQNFHKLKYFWLGGNNFSEEEKEKLKKWLPNCEIDF